MCECGGEGRKMKARRGECQRRHVEVRGGKQCQQRHEGGPGCCGNGKYEAE